jgi:aryl-alcohol dehydrogenase-like predicted oxidoreductase
MDSETDEEEIMRALHDIVQSGKVRYIGASTMRAVEFASLQFTAEKNGWTKFISMQNYYNLMYREEEREMIPFCNKTGVGLVPYSPVARGLLARPLGETSYRQQTDNLLKMLKIGEQAGDDETIRRVEKVAKDKGVAMAQVALAWLFTKGACPIVGFNKVERMEEAVGALKVKLTADEIIYLEEAYLPHAHRL